MTVAEWLDISTRSLRASSSPRLDAELLLADVLGKNRAWIHAHDDEILSYSNIKRLGALLAKRLRGHTIPHILGRSNFYGREFMVSQRVLSPRPESEAFFAGLARLMHKQKNVRSLIDIGTGSGILAITAKLEHPHLQVTGTDISKSALAVAQKNADTHSVDIKPKKQNLLEGDVTAYDIVLANLPYVPIDMRHPSILHEPSRALYSGNDGLNHYRRLFTQLQSKNIQHVLAESLESQHEALLEIAHRSGYLPVDTLDLVQIYQKS